MDSDDPRHTNIQFETELLDLRTELVKMGALVQEQIAAASEALMNRDTAKAAQTVARDVEVNQMDVAIDERCIRQLALYQPTAGDLRFITTALKITGDLERMGDNAANICRRIVDLNRIAETVPYGGIPKLTELVQSLVRDSLEAFLKSDADRAEAAMARDDEAHALSDEIGGEVLSYMVAHPRSTTHGTGILFVIKSLERISDHAANIAEMVVFMVKGKLILHMDRRKS